MATPKAIIEINGTKHVLTFGLDFLEALNNKWAIVGKSGIEMGAGINKALIEIQVKNPAIIRDIILFGTMSNRAKPKNDEIEEYIMDNLMDDDRADKMFDDFFDIWAKIPGASRVKKELDLKKKEDQETEAVEEAEL